VISDGVGQEALQGPGPHRPRQIRLPPQKGAEAAGLAALNFFINYFY